MSPEEQEISEMDIDDLELINKKTGERIDIHLLFVKDGGSFNKVFLEQLSEMIGCTGDGVNKVLGWMLKFKNNKNEINGTQREIAENLHISPFTVTKVFKALRTNNFLEIKRSGCYVLNPKVMHYGGTGNKIAILRIWNEIKAKEK